MRRVTCIRKLDRNIVVHKSGGCYRKLTRIVRKRRIQTDSHLHNVKDTGNNEIGLKEKWFIIILYLNVVQSFLPNIKAHLFLDFVE